MKIKLLSIALFVIATTAMSCSNDNDDNQIVVPTPTPAATDGFTWTENGGSTVHTAASATFSTQYKTMIVKDAANATLFEINLNGTTAATYDLASGNAFTYTAANPFFTASAGSVVITSNNGSKVSGTFRANGNGGGITAMEGTFTNINVIP